jgi:hypothetical protein
MKSVFLSLIFLFSVNFTEPVVAKDNRNVFCIRTVNDREWLWCCIAERKEQCLYKRGKDTPTKFLIDTKKNPDFIYSEIEYIMQL